jgi:hypothetical protein
MKKKEILGQVELLKHRIDNLESDYSQVLVKYAKLESGYILIRYDSLLCQNSQKIGDMLMIGCK